MEYECDSWSESRPDAIPTLHNYKADGAIGGGIAFAIVGDHENRPTDMTNILVIYEDADRKTVF